MRVLHVLHSAYPDVTGASIRSRYLVETQAALGLEPAVVSSPFQPPVDPAHAAGVEWLNGIPYHRTFDASYDHRFMVARKSLATRVRKLTALPSFTGQVRRVARERRADVLHGHSLFFSGLAAVFAARSLGLPSVYEVRSLIEDGLVHEGGASERGVLYRAYRRFDQLTVRLATHVTTISQGLRSDLIARGVPAERITVIGNGVDVAKQAPLPARDAALHAELGFPADAFVLGYIGTLFAYESLDVAVDAIRNLAPTMPELRLLIVGDGNARDGLIEQARRLNVADRIKFVSRVSHEDIGRYYSLIDLCVLPRRPNRLTDLVTPLKPLEIMARAKPLLASNCGGQRELVVHGENGLLYDANVAEGLADAIRSVAARRAELPEFGRRARAWVAANRSWEAAIRPTVELYSTLVDRTTRSASPKSVASVVGTERAMKETPVL